MEFWQYLSILLVCFLGIISGYFTSLIASEELRKGKTYFEWFAKIIVFLIMLFFILMYEKLTIFTIIFIIIGIIIVFATMIPFVGMIVVLGSGYLTYNYFYNIINFEIILRFPINCFIIIYIKQSLGQDNQAKIRTDF